MSVKKIPLHWQNPDRYCHHGCGARAGQRRLSTSGRLAADVENTGRKPIAGGQGRLESAHAWKPLGAPDINRFTAENAGSPTRSEEVNRFQGQSSKYRVVFALPVTIRLPSGVKANMRTNDLPGWAGRREIPLAAVPCHPRRSTNAPRRPSPPLPTAIPSAFNTNAARALVGVGERLQRLHFFALCRVPDFQQALLRPSSPKPCDPPTASSRRPCRRKPASRRL